MFNTDEKIAIVYDWIDKWGGVERVLLHLHSLFPRAQFFSSAVSLQKAPWAKKLTIHSSFIQSLPSGVRSQRALMAPLFPFAFEAFTLSEYDLVISVTSAFAKGVITKPGTRHICYLLTPPRYLWSHIDDYAMGIKKFIGSPFLSHLKKWDMIAAHRPDSYISISHTTAQRAKDTYGVDSSVIYPPFDTEYWDAMISKSKKPAGIDLSKPYYLWVGRMESYKKPELILEVAKKNLQRNYIFVGVGSLEKKLRRNAPQNCQFTGHISDECLSYLYSHAQALLMPQNEDFGYVSLESQYQGCPVIAFRGGGATETIQEGVTGLFFDEQTTTSLASQLERFEQISYNLSHSTKQIQKTIKEKYGMQRFDGQFLSAVQRG